MRGQKMLRRRKRRTYEVDHAVEVFKPFFLEHSRVHIVFEVPVVHLYYRSVITTWKWVDGGVPVVEYSSIRGLRTLLRLSP